jgi:hypothetical protein
VAYVPGVDADPGTRPAIANGTWPSTAGSAKAYPEAIRSPSMTEVLISSTLYSFRPCWHDSHLATSCIFGA